MYSVYVLFIFIAHIFEHLYFFFICYFNGNMNIGLLRKELPKRNNIMVSMLSSNLTDKTR